jgi:hypothetical protein
MDAAGINSREFLVPCDDKKILIGHAIFMNRSAYIWVSDPDTMDNSMKNLIMSMKTKYDAMPLSTSLFTELDEDNVNAIAIRLAKRHGIQIYFSSGIDFDILNAQHENASMIVESSLSNMLSEAFSTPTGASSISSAAPEIAI